MVQMLSREGRTHVWTELQLQLYEKGLLMTTMSREDRGSITGETALSRRQALRQLGLGCASLAGATVLGQERTARRVDTHLHCFAGSNDLRFPYHDRAPYRPVDAATPEHLLSCMDEAGVAHAVVVHPEPYQDDHRYLRHCLEVGGGRLKGTCLVFADRPDSMDKLTGLARSLPIIAARVHAYAPDRLPPFDRPELRQLWVRASDLGLAIQLHFEPRYAPGFEPLIKEFGKTTVIIDHLGRPFQGTPEEHETVLRWGRFSNTVIKLSAIPPQRSYPHRNIRPIIRQLVESFGAERMIYGGGFGADASGDSYRAAFARASGFIDFLSPPDRDRVLGENAISLFGW